MAKLPLGRNSPVGLDLLAQPEEAAFMVDQIFEHLPALQQRHPPQVKAIEVDQITA